MSVEHLAVVLHHSKAKGTAKLVLIGIANHQGDGGSWPSARTLATYANVDVSSVRKAIRQLRSSGELRVDVQGGGDRDCPDELRPNLYHVMVQCPPWCDRTPNHRDTRRLAGRQRSLFGARTPLGDNAYPPQAITPRDPWAGTPTKPPTTTTPLHVVVEPQDARAREQSTVPCADCGQGEAKCQRVQRAWPPGDRHPYRAVAHG